MQVQFLLNNEYKNILYLNNQLIKNFLHIKTYNKE